MARPKSSDRRWPTKVLARDRDVFALIDELQGKRWLSRGQSLPHNSIHPSIDRGHLKGLARAAKLRLERQSINLFRSTVRYWAPGEESNPGEDVRALMVMRHYGVPTRLLDWSTSPYVALYFAVAANDDEDGEVWSFDEPRYEIEGAKQWARWPETTLGGEGPPAPFVPELTMFSTRTPPPWFVCQFYPAGFPRQTAQHGAYSLTSDFDRDHASAISELLGNTGYMRLQIRASIKRRLRQTLQQSFGVWRGSLYPDSAGAAQTAMTVFNDD